MNLPARLSAPLYVAVNAGFALLVLIGALGAGSPNPRSMYLIALFALCTCALISDARLNGRSALLNVFLAIYFVFYGVTDLLALLSGVDVGGSQGVLSAAEVAILLGAALLIVGYRSALAIVERQDAGVSKDWSKAAVVGGGLLLWAIGTAAVWIWNVEIVVDTTIEAVDRGLATLSRIETSLLVLAQMLQPVGVLIVAYAQTRYRSRFLLLIVVAIVLAQVVIGFVIDVKTVAMLGGILVIMTKILVEGRLPKAWLAAAALFLIFAFPVFQAFRVEVRGNYGIARADVVRDLGRALEIALAGKDKVTAGPQRAQTFFERASLKGSVELIVARAGADVRFQNGATLAPLLGTFVPKLLWHDKPDAATGRIMNREFDVSDVADTYISPSHLGELYWNFGWPGVLMGMPLIGFMAGFVGARCDLSRTVTVTRLLIAVLTVRQLMVGFEGSIAVQYVVWLRSLAAIAVLHSLFARVPAWAQPAGPVSDGAESLKQLELAVAKPVPNLMA